MAGDAGPTLELDEQELARRYRSDSAERVLRVGTAASVSMAVVISLFLVFDRVVVVLEAPILPSRLLVLTPAVVFLALRWTLFRRRPRLALPFYTLQLFSTVAGGAFIVVALFAVPPPEAGWEAAISGTLSAHLFVVFVFASRARRHLPWVFGVPIGGMFVGLAAVGGADQGDVSMLVNPCTVAVALIVMALFQDRLDRVEVRSRVLAEHRGAQLAREVERHRDTARELQERALELDRSNQELQQLAQVASHDLKQPLRTISSFLALLRKRLDSQLAQDDKSDRYMRFAEDGAIQASALIDGLLLYARADRAGGVPGPLDLNRVLEVVRVHLSVALEEAGGRLTVGQLPTLETDPDPMVRLFQNLVENAIKYRRPGVPLEISVEVDETDGGPCFAVRDNGIGIDPKHHDELFTLFRRLHTRDEYSGVGIGLATCKKIVERYGGRIWIESTAGEGAAFLFTLPREPIGASSP